MSMRFQKGGVVWCRKRLSEMSAGINRQKTKREEALGNRNTGRLACTGQQYHEKQGTQETMKAGEKVSDI